MSNLRTYLDWNATAPIYPEVVEAMSQTLLVGGNASSVHQEGRRARGKIELARERVAGLVKANPQDIIFTSGGSEANALAFAGLRRNGTVDRLLISSIEHPSVLASAEIEGAAFTVLDVDGDGIIDLEKLEKELAKAVLQNERALVSIMWANNETGVIQPMEKIVELAHSHGALVHCDAVQAMAKIPVDFNASNLDLMSLSAHKIGGPQGVGALVVGANLTLAPIIRGGGQELKRRGGTENLSGIVGFGLAAELSATQDHSRQMTKLHHKLESKIKQIRSDVVIFGEQCERLPNTSCIALASTTAETLLIALDLAGVAVSSGSACSSGKVAKSHVLAAMGVDDLLARSAIRISLGRTTTSADIENFIKTWTNVVGTMPQHQATVAA